MKLKRNMLVLVVLLLSLTLVIAACSSSNNGGSSSSSSGSSSSGSSSGSSSTPSGSSSSSDEPVTLKIFVPSNVEEFPDGQDVNNNLLYEYLNEVTGYNIEWEIAPRESVDQKINLMMASGETPDLIVTPNKTIFTNLAQQGLLTPVDGLVEEHAPRVMAEVTDDAWSAVTFEGSRYAIPVPQNQVSTTGFAIRKDWLEKLGLPEPRTIDDIYDVMVAFKEQDPSGNGTIPLTAGAADGNGNAFGYLDAFAGAFGIVSPWIVEGDEVIHTRIQPQAKEFLIFMNKLYSEGLLDQEYPVNKQANVFEKLVNGQAGMSTFGWASKNVFESLHERDPDAELVYIQPPIGPHGDWGYTMHQPVRTYFIIPQFSDKAVEVIDFINKYMEPEVMDTISYGYEGVHHEVLDDGFINNLPEMEEIRYRIYYRLWDTSKDFNNRVRLSGFLPYYEPIMEHARVTNILNFAPPIEEVETTAQELTDLTNEYFVKIITGALPIDAFDEFVEKWLAGGGDEAIRAVNEWYETFK